LGLEPVARHNKPSVPAVQRLQSLAIISHVPHHEWEGRVYAYGPYAREVEVWAELFPQVVIAAPLRHEAPPGDAIPFSHGNIFLQPQLETGGDNLLAKARQLLTVPRHLWRLRTVMRRADAIHVRCPGNLGLLGCLLAPCFRKPRVAKYAGQWTDYPGEPRPWRWQKALLRSRWWKAPVLVYGQWPDQPRHIVPFFTSVMDQGQMDRARAAAPRDWSRRPLEVLFVGRLSAAKNVDVLLRAVGQLTAEGEAVRLRVVGDGPVRGQLEQLVSALGIAERVVFTGAVGPATVLGFYEHAHVLVLASQTEGWPKAIAEGMAFGLVCIGARRGLVPQMLGEGKGLLVEPGDPAALAGALQRVARDGAEAARMAERGAAWARQFTLETFGQALRKLLAEWWGIPGDARS
jgi:glycosyltransferase involved in cell wall biosynthesis